MKQTRTYETKHGRTYAARSANDRMYLTDLVTPGKIVVETGRVVRLDRATSQWLAQPSCGCEAISFDTLGDAACCLANHVMNRDTHALIYHEAHAKYLPVNVITPTTRGRHHGPGLVARLPLRHPEAGAIPAPALHQAIQGPRRPTNGETIMSTTIDTLPEDILWQAENLEEYSTVHGLTIHTAQTPYGEVRFTIESPDGGNLWFMVPVVINGTPHSVIGTYTFGHEYDNETGAWAKNLAKPVAHVGGYPGPRRLDATRDFMPAEPTDNARRKLDRALGDALAPAFADPAEGLANERELAAQTYERRAKQAEEDAAREIERAMSYRAKAAAIRNGADWDRKGI